MKKLSIFTLLLALACTSTPANAPAVAPKSEFKNLKVLPQDIPREQLLATMRSFTRGLGVRCDHCHVVTATEPKQVLDFPSDAKETKRAARVMLQMVMQVNDTWIPRVQTAAGDPPPAAGAAPEMRVMCWTCHRGKPEPEAPPPPANGPQGAPPPH
jgi:photosynthetic reaction center cytochrome c subunit